MRLRFLPLVLIFSIRLVAVEVEQPENEDLDDLQELREVQALMVEVRDYLRADRHDKVVQIKEKEIEDRLEKIGHEIDAQEKRDEKNARFAPEDGNLDKPKKPARKPPSKTNIPAVVTNREPQTVFSKDWTNLPPEERHSIVQTYANEVPARWRKRIEAYFISIQEEESKRAAEKDEHDRVTHEGDYAIPTPQAPDENH